MTEMAMDGAQDQGISEPVNTSAPQVQSAPQAADERTFRQAEVNEIVKRAKYDALESYKRMAAEQPQYLQQKTGNEASTSQPIQQADYSRDDYIRKLAAEEAQRHFDAVKQDALQQSQNDAAQRTVNNFFSKIATGKDKYQDYDAVTGDVDLARFPNVVQLLAEHIDNSDDVFYELGKDRIKMANLEQLAQMSPRDAVIQAQRLAKSLKDNQAASNVRQPNEPLSQLRPSNTGTDNGILSVSDYRKKYIV